MATPKCCRSSRCKSACSPGVDSELVTGGRSRSCARSSKRVCLKIPVGEEHHAASTGRVRWLRICMQKAESPTQADINGFAALHTAALHGRLDCIQMLVEKFKADVNQASLTGWRPIHLVVSKESGTKALPCLMYLINQGADVNVQNIHGISPLHRAASEGFAQCVQALIEAGADVFAMDTDGQQPIDMSKMWGHRVCARYLANAMWNLSKAEFARNINKLNEIKTQCAMKEKEFLEAQQMKIDFCNSLAFEQWLTKKRLPPLPGRILRLLESKRYSTALRRYAGDMLLPSTPSKVTEVPQEIPSEARKVRPWNLSTKLSSTPVTRILRPATVRLGVEPEKVTDHDFGSFLLLYKDTFGEPQIQVENLGNITDVPPLPFEVIEKSLFPRTRSTRLDVPKDLRPLHLLDLKHRRPLGARQKWTDQMALSLRQTLDPVFLDTLRAHVSTYSDPKVLSPRGGSELSSSQENVSTQSPVSSCQE